MSLEIFSCHHNLAHHFLMDQSAASNTLFAFLELWRSVLWGAFSAAGASPFEKTQVVGHARMQFSACMAPNKWWAGWQRVWHAMAAIFGPTMPIYT